MPQIEVPAVVTTLTANGGATGILTVTSTTGFYAGCEAFMSDSTGLNKRVIIVSITDGTHMVVRAIADDNENQVPIQIYGAGSTMAAFTLANSSKVSMPSQLARVEFSNVAPASLNK